METIYKSPEFEDYCVEQVWLLNPLYSLYILPPGY